MNKFMKIAIDEAKKGILNGDGGPFGSCVVKNGQIIAKGHNRVVANNDPTCNGEIDAIRKACEALGTFNLKGCELYTTGQPCPMCACACLWANIDIVYYGCTIDDNEMIGFRDKHFYEMFDMDFKNTDKFIQIERKECLKLFNEYNLIKNKTMY